MSVSEVGAGTVPAKGETIVFVDANFGGKAYKVTGNVYDLRGSGINDVISSIKVGPNTKAFFFKDDRYNGDYFRVTEGQSNANLAAGAGTFNDQISSIIVASFESA